MLFLYNTHPPNIMGSKSLRERIILKIHRKPVKHTFIELVIDENRNKDLLMARRRRFPIAVCWLFDFRQDNDVPLQQ